MKVFIIAALSLDGFIAQEKKQSSIGWTSQEDQQHFQQITQKSGVIVMGSTTFATIGFPLPKRLNIVYSSQSKADFIEQYDLDEEQAQRLRVVDLEPSQLIKNLEEEGFGQVAICGGSSIYTQFLAAGVVDELQLTIEPFIFGDGIKLFGQVAICGGSSIYTQFLAAGVVDELQLTIEPVIFGDGIKLFGQQLEQRLKLVDQTQLNDRGTLLLTYQIQNTNES